MREAGNDHSRRYCNQPDDSLRRPLSARVAARRCEGKPNVHRCEDRNGKWHCWLRWLGRASSRNDRRECENLSDRQARLGRRSSTRAHPAMPEVLGLSTKRLGTSSEKPPICHSINYGARAATRSWPTRALPSLAHRLTAPSWLAATAPRVFAPSSFVFITRRWTTISPCWKRR